MTTGQEFRSFIGWMVEPAKYLLPSTLAEAAHFTTTSIGNAGGTTTVCTALTNANAYAYVGRRLVCVGPDTSENYGHHVWVLEFDPATDTLTHTPFPAQVASGDQMRLQELPIASAVETTGGGTSTIAAGLAGVGTDYFDDGDYLVAEQADNIADGLYRPVTAFNSGTGAFTQTVWGANTAIGDLYSVRRFPKTLGMPAMKWGVEDLPHDVQKGTFDQDQSVRGQQSWSCEGITCSLKGSGTAAGDGVVGLPLTEIHKNLQAILATRTSTGDLAADVPTTTDVRITNGNMARFPVGSFMLSRGRLTCVESSAAGAGGYDSIGVRPALLSAPVAAETVYGGYTYYPKTSGHQSTTIDAWIGGVARVIGIGGMPTSIKITDLGKNKIPKIVFGYAGDAFIEMPFAEYANLIPPPQVTQRPVSAANANVMIVPTGSTTVTMGLLESAEIDFGIQTVQEPVYTLPEGSFGRLVTGMKPVITMTFLLDTTTPNNSWREIQRSRASKTASIMLQHDFVAGRVLGFFAYKAEYQNPEHSVDAGRRKFSMKCFPIESGLSGMPMFVFGGA